MTDQFVSSSPPKGDDDVYPLDLVVLERYWLGEASAEERATLDAWFAAHPEQQLRYRRFHRALTGEPLWTDLSAKDVGRITSSIFQNAGLRREEKSAPARIHPSAGGTAGRAAGRTVGLIGVAAAALLMVGLSWATLRDRFHAPAPSEHTYVTGIGQRYTFALADGSRVTLAPQTTVRVPATFGVSTRTISVVGESHFDITSNTGIPFIVRTTTTSVRVLGTRFVVKQYREDRAAHIAVETGKVSVERGTHPATVVAARQVATATDSGVVINRETRLVEYTDWINGQLTFQRTPLPDVLETLSRWYGVRFRIADSSLVSTRILGTLSHGSLEDMLTSLKELLKVSITHERQDNGSLMITLHPIRTETPAPRRHERPVSIPSTFGR